MTEEDRSNLGSWKYCLKLRGVRDADSPFTNFSEGKVPRKSIRNHLPTWVLLFVKEMQEVRGNAFYVYQ